MNCIIIDDEPKAIEILVRYVHKIGDIDLLATFDRPLEALIFLKSVKPDFILLDINMPDIDGLQLSKLLKDIPVIFTTAYPQYALESYEVSAIDYLLKPISFARFLQAVEKVRAPQKYKGTPADTSLPDHPDKDVVFIKSGPKTYRVSIDDIYYLETQGNYMIFHTKDIKIAARLTVNGLNEILPMDRFIRIHKSFIIPKEQISVIESHQVTIKANVKLPIGAAYREEFKRNF